jgi:glycosyltransferase involved in cell wall biosynthesis
MRIGFTIYNTLDTLTGGYIYDHILVHHLRNRGHEIDLISLPRRPYGGQVFDNLAPSVFSRIIHSPVDLLLQDALCHPSLFIVNKKLKQKVNIPIISLIHQVLSIQPRNRWINTIYRFVERHYLASVDGFIFNSKSTRHAVENLTDRKKPSLVAYPAGDRLGHLKSKEKVIQRAGTKGPLKLLFVGNVLPNKGLYPLIDGLSHLSREFWQLTVIGSLSMDTVCVRRIESLINRKRLSDRIKLIGSAGGATLAQYLSKSQVLAMPYSHEGFGMAIIEGMAFGLPAIGSVAGAAHEIIFHGQNGFLVSPGDNHALLNHIRQLHMDRDRLAKMGCAAFTTFKAHPTWQDTMNAIHNFVCK